VIFKIFFSGIFQHHIQSVGLKDGFVPADFEGEGKDNNFGGGEAIPIFGQNFLSHCFDTIKIEEKNVGLPRNEEFQKVGMIVRVEYDPKTGYLIEQYFEAFAVGLAPFNDSYVHIFCL
jgi:hypothetical protein